MTKHTLLGLSGALRADSANRKLLREAARIYDDCILVEANLALPLYDGDDEVAHGIPMAVAQLVQQIDEADAVLISTPEYNSGISGVLKNALDWVSRDAAHPWGNKPVAVMSAAAGRAGGARAQTMLRSCMVPFRARLANGPEVMVANCNAQFDENGRVSESYAKALEGLMASLRADVIR